MKWVVSFNEILFPEIDFTEFRINNFKKSSKSFLRIHSKLSTILKTSNKKMYEVILFDM